MDQSKVDAAASNEKTSFTNNDGDIMAETMQSDSKETDHPEENICDYVTGYKLAIIMASICLSCARMLLDTMIISTAIPRITDTFNSLPDVGWYASAYQFGSAAPQPLTGQIYTEFRTKWAFLAFFAVFEIGSLLCGAANSSNMLIVGRAVAGFGAAGIITGSITIIASCAPLEKRPGNLPLDIELSRPNTDLDQPSLA
ncbi:efflux pump [Moelleriella libera RCEF 2490]|uniref:Efflux pump n=1 Tax=Moelleriella libera RCEF 2490 TaxID=1081109 RepID=A0A166PM17_9HYPO|nr:efflux pump [Moelleriella libera RCEF 2490]